MKRVGFLLKVKPHLVEEYKQHHENVWQEMKDALSRQGWHNYSLFLRDDGLLFGYVEVADSFQARWQAWKPSQSTRSGRR